MVLIALPPDCCDEGRFATRKTEVESIICRKASPEAYWGVVLLSPSSFDELVCWYLEKAPAITPCKKKIWPGDERLYWPKKMGKWQVIQLICHYHPPLNSIYSMYFVDRSVVEHFQYIRYEPHKVFFFGVCAVLNLKKSLHWWWLGFEKWWCAWVVWIDDNILSKHVENTVRRSGVEGFVRGSMQFFLMSGFFISDHK